MLRVLQRPRRAAMLYEARDGRRPIQGLNVLTIAFSKTLDRVPPEVRDQLRSRLEEIARTLASLPSGGAVWDSLYESGMLLEVGGWRFQYRIDRDKQQMIVQAAQFHGA